MRGQCITLLSAHHRGCDLLRRIHHIAVAAPVDGAANHCRRRLDGHRDQRDYCGAAAVLSRAGPVALVAMIHRGRALAARLLGYKHYELESVTAGHGSFKRGRHHQSRRPLFEGDAP